jgi:hypothetical protein
MKADCVYWEQGVQEKIWAYESETKRELDVAAQQDL